MQTQLFSFVSRNWIPLLAAFAVYSTAVDAMEEPTPSSGPVYRYVYRFAHGLAFNLVTAFGKIGRTPWAGETPKQ